MTRRDWHAKVATIACMVETVPGVATEIAVPEAGRRPRDVLDVTRKRAA